MNLRRFYQIESVTVKFPEDFGKKNFYGLKGGKICFYNSTTFYPILVDFGQFGI